MNYNKYEGMLGSVKKAEKFANRMNACVELIRSQGCVCRRDLTAVVPNPNYYLDLLERFGIVRSEVRAEEIIDIKYDEWFFHTPYLMRMNEDGTMTVQRNSCYSPATIHDFNIEKHERTTYNGVEILDHHITGKQTVQVKRKYWVWKV